MALSDKQFKFVAEYMVSGNATQAAMAAGYTKNEKAAKTQGSRLLSNVTVAAEIAKHRERVEQSIKVKAEAKGVTEERWLDEVASLALSDVTQLFSEGNDGKLTMSMRDIKERGVGRLIRKIRVLPNGKLEVELHAKIPALELLAKATRNGWIKDIQEHQGELNVNPGLPAEALKQLHSDPEALKMARALALRMAKPGEPTGSGQGGSNG